ncbi:M20/M25/M40 family metallo-hydrolase [Kineosporia succinea]|uniref:Acetylornithine deacetylase/succinyl-diaminopimelate desuccinylase-like protein n=1 Tax=Kineosporia succinea TaxID=84632 RepID=A0ABT9PA16_9ACTN|nr:M20/M25/M40 family metallo-hydrolase [Kineosporia succinea]MDP9829537.1 acetylornithine deacetylase/succinyl-diaminopimelate desuccinylase-like protein [Kineosporia succinea]
MSAVPADAVPLLRSMIRAACVNDGRVESGQEMRNVELLLGYLGGRETLESLGVEVHVIEPRPGRGNLVLRLPGSVAGAPSLALVGHLDVVPADAAAWTHDPFGAELIAGEIWGRGAVDMLSLTASMAVAFRMVAESGVRPAGDLVLAATADEEAGSRWGMGWLVEHHPDLVLTDLAVTESGGGLVLGPADARRVTVTIGQKGAAGRKIVVRGESGHGSMPYGVNSGTLLAAEVVRRVAGHRPAAVVAAEGWWPDLLAALGFSPALVARLCDSSTVDDALPETGEYARVLHALSHMTLSPNVLQAGAKVNVIPGEGRVEIDVRLLPGQSGADTDAELEAALDGLPGVTVEKGLEAPALVTEATDPLYRAIAAASAEVYPGAEPLPLLTPGGNDARHYLSRGRPCYGFGLFSPTVGLADFRRRFHGDDERVDAQSVELCARTYERVVRLLGTV